jgi:hypothetical protein|tara:strand:- start:3345 stop:4106 length:762 start_codon:yes stop_codon:yes gene_type:complete
MNKVEKMKEYSSNSDYLPILTNKAFKRGEELTYKLHYGFLDAAFIQLNVTNEKIEFLGRETFHVVGIGKTAGITDLIFKVRDRYETYIDENSLVPWLFKRRVNEGGYIINQYYSFDRFKNKVVTENEKEFIVSDNIQDMISAFYQARTLDFSKIKKGDIFSLDCFMDEEVYPVKIKFQGFQTVEIKLGDFKCLKFTPVIQTGRIFKNEDDLSIYVSNDRNHILIKAVADILFGTIEVELTEFKGLINKLDTKK